jgi:hypothetical protein
MILGSIKERFSSHSLEFVTFWIKYTGDIELSPLWYMSRTCIATNVGNPPPTPIEMKLIVFDNFILSFRRHSNLYLRVLLSLSAPSDMNIIVILSSVFSFNNSLFISSKPDVMCVPPLL